MKKVLILGASGLIGHQVYYCLDARGCYDITTMSHQHRLNAAALLLDACDEQLLTCKIIEVRPDIIVNCMGVLISESRRNPDRAIFLNAYIPQRLKLLANRLGARLIHISTDCVFSGGKGCYHEDDIKDADNIYGRTKALGEVTDPPHLTLRTSVVGPELKKGGEELFHWFMNQHGTVQGYANALWSGVTTLELAKAVDWAITSSISGLYHVTNGVPISKYDLLMLFKKYTGKEIVIERVAGRETDKTLVDTRRERVEKIPDYDIMVRDMVEWIAAHPERYAQYAL